MMVSCSLDMFHKFLHKIRLKISVAYGEGTFPVFMCQKERSTRLLLLFKKKQDYLF